MFYIGKGNLFGIPVDYEINYQEHEGGEELKYYELTFFTKEDADEFTRELQVLEKEQPKPVEKEWKTDPPWERGLKPFHYGIGMYDYKDIVEGYTNYAKLFKKVD